MPTYIYNLETNSQVDLFHDSDSYLGAGSTSEKSTKLIKIFLAKNIPLIHTFEMTGVNTNTWMDGLVVPGDNVNSGKQLEERTFHTGILVGYDDNKFGGAFEFQSSWGTGGITDDGRLWIKYEDFYNITISTWFLISDEWKHLENITQFYRYKNPEIFNVAISKEIETEGGGKSSGWGEGR